MNITLPNSFQTPNFVVDQVLHLLKPEEYVVLSFAIRHILGWKDRIGGRQHTISLSCFEDGYSDREGNLTYGGCGLTRPKIKQALEVLVKYGLLKKIGEPGPDGQCWELPFDAPVIDWDGLRARKNAATTKNRQRISKAAKASANNRRKEQPGSTTAVPVTSTVDVPPLSTTDVPAGEYDSRTTPSTADVPPVSTTDVLNQTQLQIQSSNPDLSGTPDGGQQAVGIHENQISSSTPPATPRKQKSTPKSTIPADQMNPMKDAIVAAFGWAWETMTDVEKGQVQKAAQQLCKAKATPGQIAGLYAFCQRRFQHFSPMALTSSWSAYLQGGSSHGANNQRDRGQGNPAAGNSKPQRPQLGQLPPRPTPPGANGRLATG